MTRKALIGLILAVLLPLVALLWPGGLGMAPRLALALSAFTVVFWTFEPVPIEYTSLLLLLLFPLCGVLPFEAGFAPFASKTFWLIFAGMALSLGITETPLGPRLARFILGRARSYGRLLLGIHLLGILSALLIPSGVVRVLILMPVLVSLLEAMGEKPGSRASAALILGLVCATYYGGTGMLTASVPNLVVFGVLESRGITVYWGEWTAYLFPVIGLCRVGCAYLLIRLLLPVRQAPDLVVPPAADAGLPEAVTPAEKKVVAVLLLGVLLWATDALHGIHPAYVGLGLVLLYYLPGWGPLHPDKLRQVNFPILIYIAAALAMGHALEEAGLSARLSALFTDWLNLSGTGAAVRLGAITYLVLPFDFLADTAAIAAILTPVLLDFGAQLSLAPVPVALSVAIGTSLAFFPYQAAPFIMAYSFRYVRMGQFIRLMVLLSLLTLLILLPLNLLYWRLIGLI